LRTSLSNSTAATYTLGSKQTFTLRQAGQAIGQLGLEYGGPFGIEGDWGWITLSNPGDLPASWDIGSFNVDGTRIEGDVDASNIDGTWWGWFEGTISSDGSQITNMTLEYTGWSSQGTMSNLSAQRTANEPLTAQFNPNPLFAGSVAPRNMLPQFDSEGEPIPGTVGHGLNNDATLGGVTPGMTQDDWLGRGYEVYGIPDPNALQHQPMSRRRAVEFLRHLDEYPDLLTKLGASTGATATFSGNYPQYLVVARSRVLVDAIQSLHNDYLDANDVLGVMNLSAFDDDLTGMEVISPSALVGPPDGNCAPVGELGFFGRLTGFVPIANPGGWTGLTVVTNIAPLPCTPNDWNEDTIVSIVGEVPPFVQCVYFGNCPDWPQEKRLCIGDCNHDGIISIIGDVPCFVQCVYFGDCPE
jgi:hypothetical protein